MRKSAYQWRRIQPDSDRPSQSGRSPTVSRFYWESLHGNPFLRKRLAGADPFHLDLLFNAYDITNPAKPKTPKP